MTFLHQPRGGLYAQMSYYDFLKLNLRIILSDLLLMYLEVGIL